MATRRKVSLAPERDVMDRSHKSPLSSNPNTLDPARVERLAYALWEERGRPDGSAAEDWLRAEQLLREDLAR